MRAATGRPPFDRARCGGKTRLVKGRRTVPDRWNKRPASRLWRFTPAAIVRPVPDGVAGRFRMTVHVADRFAGIFELEAPVADFETLRQRQAKRRDLKLGERSLMLSPLALL